MAEPTKATPWITASGRELKLALVTALAGIYLAIWLPLGVGAAGGSAPDAIAQERVADSSLVPGSTQLSAPQLVWVDQLPASERPLLVVPEGWVVADPSRSARVGGRERERALRADGSARRSEPDLGAAPAAVERASPEALVTARVTRARGVPVRVATTRAHRIRTRSS